MNPDSGDGNSPSPYDSFAKIFHVIEQSEDRINQTNELASRIARSGFLHRSMLLGPVIATVPRTHANGTPLPPMVYRSALYAPMGLGVSASWAANAMAGKPWATRSVKGAHIFTRYDNCPFMWRYILVKRNLHHLGQLTGALLVVLGKQLKRFLKTGGHSMRKKHSQKKSTAGQKHQDAVNALVSLLARLVAIRHLNNEVRKRNEGNTDTEKP